MLLFLNVIYVLVAIAMIALILMQRGAGAQAGSGFGAGASGTVFGARGASNFLSKSTKWLAIAFFAISLFMAWSATRNNAAVATPAGAQQGLMAEVPAAPSGGATVPAAPATTAPANTVPAAPQSTAPVQPLPTVPADAGGAEVEERPEPAKPVPGG